MLVAMSQRLVQIIDDSFVWILAPLIVFATISMAIACRQITDRRLSVVASVMTKSSSTVMTVFVSLKLWQIVHWSWSETTWPAWLVMAILLGVSFITGSITVGRLTGVLRREEQANREFPVCLFMSVSSMSSLALMIALYRSVIQSTDKGEIESSLRITLWSAMAAAAIAAGVVTVCGNRLWYSDGD